MWLNHVPTYVRFLTPLQQTNFENIVTKGAMSHFATMFTILVHLHLDSYNVFKVSICCIWERVNMLLKMFSSAVSFYLLYDTTAYTISYKHRLRGREQLELPPIFDIQ